MKFYFLGGNNIQRDKVRQVIPEWMIYCSIIFLETQNVADSVVRINFLPDIGSFSKIGTDARHVPATQPATVPGQPPLPGDPTMNLDSIDAAASTITESERGTILHEFGHVLGMAHEHQSPTRGGRITMDAAGETLPVMSACEMNMNDDTNIS